jgi:taurine dioxygenase
MSIRVTRLAPALGAVVEGVVLAEEPAPATVARVGELLLEHQLLFFRNQPLTPLQQAAFAARFRAPHMPPVHPVLPDLPEIMVLHTHPDFLRDDDQRPTGVTFSTIPPLAGIQAGRRICGGGTDTLWSSMSCAYDALSIPFKRLLGGLTAQHSVAKSFPPERRQSDPVFRERYERALARYPPLDHSVVRTHPVSGRKALFVNEDFTTQINGLGSAEGRALLGFLFEHITRPEFTLCWRWQEGDVAFWDSRLTQPCAIADTVPQWRAMHRATVNGDGPF